MSNKDDIDSKSSCRSWFCVWNNPQLLFPETEPYEIAENVLDVWVSASPTRTTRTGAVAYCISAEGLEHLHMVLEDTNKSRFSALKKLFPKAHIEPTKGNKEQAEDYINKKGKYAEKGEQVLYIARFGEIKGNQGARRDFDIIQDLLDSGATPAEIMSSSFAFRRYERMIKSAYYDIRKKKTPVHRKVDVYWLFGDTGSGKTYTIIDLIEKYGEGNIYLVSDYGVGFMDNYNGEKVIVLDEFRGQLPYSTILVMLQGYKQQIHARYSNVWTLWDKVYITSPFTPYEVYNCIAKNDNYDLRDQLYRRITQTIKCLKTENGYEKIELDGAKKRTDFIGLNKTNNADCCSEIVYFNCSEDGSGEEQITGLFPSVSSSK